MPLLPEITAKAEQAFACCMSVEHSFIMAHPPTSFWNTFSITSPLSNYQEYVLDVSSAKRTCTELNLYANNPSPTDWISRGCRALQFVSTGFTTLTNLCNVRKHKAHVHTSSHAISLSSWWFIRTQEQICILVTNTELTRQILGAFPKNNSIFPSIVFGRKPPQSLFSLD